MIHRLILIAFGVLIASCAPSPRPNGYRDHVAHVTSSGILFFAMKDQDINRLSCEIDCAAERPDGSHILSFMVYVMPSSYTVAGGFEVMGDVAPKKHRIGIAYPYSWIALRHEYHHVYLFEKAGSSDMSHLDPSWVNYWYAGGVACNCDE